MRTALMLTLLTVIAALLPACGGPVADEGLPPDVTRIAFGSCADQNKPQPIWDAVVEAEPQVFIFLGDTVYADTIDMNEMRNAYAQLNAVPGFQRLRDSNAAIFGTWDDHDFGENDAGADYIMKAPAQQVMLDFYNEPADSPRRTTPGVYVEYQMFPDDDKGLERIVQFILLDTRYFRSRLVRDPGWGRGDPGGPYHARLQSDDATILGEAQWAWLENVLKEPADIRIIATSIQFIPDEHGWEKWANFPRERQRMVDLIRRSRADAVVMISGDRHFAEISRVDHAVGYPLFEVTSSGLTNTYPKGAKERNRFRVGNAAAVQNFGLISIDWSKPDPPVSMQIRDVNGNAVIDHTVPLSLLSR